MKRVAFFAFLVFSLLACQKNEISLEEHDGYTLAIQTKGPVLGYSSAPTIMVKDLMFKDLNRSGALDPYEDWRLPAVERAEDLATRMSVEQICGLMIYSSAVTVEEPELSETQIKFLTEDNVRHVLVAGISSPGAGAPLASRRHCLRRLTLRQIHAGGVSTALSARIRSLMPLLPANTATPSRPHPEAKMAGATRASTAWSNTGPGAEAAKAAATPTFLLANMPSIPAETSPSALSLSRKEHSN